MRSACATRLPPFSAPMPPKSTFGGWGKPQNKFMGCKRGEGGVLALSQTWISAQLFSDTLAMVKGTARGMHGYAQAKMLTQQASGPFPPPFEAGTSLGMANDRQVNGHFWASEPGSPVKFVDVSAGFSPPPPPKISYERGVFPQAPSTIELLVT